MAKNSHNVSAADLVDAHKRTIEAQPVRNEGEKIPAAVPSSDVFPEITRATAQPNGGVEPGDPDVPAMASTETGDGVPITGIRQTAEKLGEARSIWPDGPPAHLLQAQPQPPAATDAPPRKMRPVALKRITWGQKGAHDEFISEGTVLSADVAAQLVRGIHYDLRPVA